MSNTPLRLTHLRRPPVMHVQDEPFVPRGVSIDEVDRRWRKLCAKNPAYFDGRIHHIINVHRNGHGGVVIHAQECAYRFHAVQCDGFDLGARPLGVKGLIERACAYLLGRRGASVAHYAGMWEFAPGGVVDAGDDPARTVIEELREETGLAASAEPVAVAIIYDDVLRTWEIVYRLRIEDDEESMSKTDEYTELRWCSANDLPQPLSPVAQKMIALL